MTANRILIWTMLAMMTLSFSGCSQDPIRAKLIGVWKIEHADKLSRRVNQDAKDGDETDEDLSERMVLSFYASGAFETKTRMGDVFREKNGSWTVVEFDEEKSKMKIGCALMGQQTEHDVQFIEEDLIRLVPPNMAGTTSKLTFRRK